MYAFLKLVFNKERTKKCGKNILFFFFFYSFFISNIALFLKNFYVACNDL